MNIFQKYGIKEVANVTLYSIELDENDDEVYVPVIFFDSLKVSTIEQSAETTSATGGVGNPKLISWDYGKEITVTLEDALFTPAHQSLMWGGKMSAKPLTLYLRNFYDKGTDPDFNTAEPYELNKALRGAELRITNFSDFVEIPDRQPYYEKKKNLNSQLTSGYVGGTSIYGWLVDGTIISNDGKIKVAVNDLIIFYREQTQKWYFFNGEGPERKYKDEFSPYDKKYYAIGYQYGKDTFDWIKRYVAGLKLGRFQLNDLDLFLKDSKEGIWFAYIDKKTNRKKAVHLDYKDGVFIDPETNQRVMVELLSNGNYKDAANKKYLPLPWTKPTGGTDSNGAGTTVFASSASTATAYAFLQETNVGMYGKKVQEAEEKKKQKKQASNSIAAKPIVATPVSTKAEELEDLSPYFYRQIEMIDDYGHNSTQEAVAFKKYYHLINFDGTERYYYSNQDAKIKGLIGVDSEQVGKLCIPASYNSSINVTTYILENWSIRSTKKPTIYKNEAKWNIKPAEYEDVAKETYKSWTQHPPCDKYGRGPNSNYDFFDLPLNFLTQDLYIDGLRTDKCARDMAYGDFSRDDLTHIAGGIGIDPYRYSASIAVEYNTNIAPPQEVIYKVDHALQNVDFLETLEKCVAPARFCIDTDVNLKHGQYRFLNKYNDTELTVFLDPKTMQPYEPNTYEYYRRNGQRITGNLRAFKQYEVYYKWTRTKAKTRETLGKQIIVDAEHYPGTFRLVGETLARSYATGKDSHYLFEIPLCKLNADTNLTLQADGDPTTFSMTFTAMRRFDGVMMKLTLFDTEEQRYGKYKSGSSRIIPEIIDGPPTNPNATWEYRSVANEDNALTVYAKEERDLAANILSEHPQDSLYKASYNSPHDDSQVIARKYGTITTVTTAERSDSTPEHPITGRQFTNTHKIPASEQWLEPDDYTAVLT